VIKAAHAPGERLRVSRARLGILASVDPEPLIDNWASADRAVIKALLGVPIEPVQFEDLA